jgi:hypothetical protein
MDEVDQPSSEATPDPTGAAGVVSEGASMPPEATAPRRRRWPFVVGAAVIVAGGITALSVAGSSSSANAAVAVANAATDSLSAGSYHFTIDSKVSIGSSGQSVAITGSGSANPAQRAMEMAGTTTTPAVTSPITLSEVLVDSTLYLSSSEFASHLPAGKSWLSVDVSALSGALGSSSGVAAPDPSSLLRTFSQPGSGIVVTDLGTGTVNGEAVHRYQAVISPEAVKSRIESSKLSDAFKTQILSGLGTSEETVTLAIDNDHHLVQMNETATLTELGQVISTTMTINLTGWGEATSITAPPSSEVYDASSLFSSLSGGSAVASGSNGGASFFGT